MKVKQIKLKITIQESIYRLWIRIFIFNFSTREIALEKPYMALFPFVP